MVFDQHHVHCLLSSQGQQPPHATAMLIEAGSLLHDDLHHLIAPHDRRLFESLSLPSRIPTLLLARASYPRVEHTPFGSLLPLPLPA
jgi:hypothetical protein